MAWYYYAAGAAALAGVALIAKGGSKQAPADDSAPAGTPMNAPLFMASGGGGSQAPTTDGVSNWIPPKVPLSENPDVAIANINAGVQMAAINAAAKLSGSAVDVVTPPIPNNNNTKYEYRGNDIAEGANYIKSIVAKTPQLGNAQVENTIYQQAKKYGYSATEVAQSFSSATGQKVTPETVNKWLSDRGLTL